MTRSNDTVLCSEGAPARLGRSPPADPPAFEQCAASIPTVTGWGLMAMTILLIGLGCVVLRRSQQQAV